LHFFWTVLSWAPHLSADTGALRTNIHPAIATAHPATICDWLPLAKRSVSEPNGASTVHDVKTGNSSEWQRGK
jgi:hypothetical protein